MKEEWMILKKERKKEKNLAILIFSFMYANLKKKSLSIAFFRLNDVKFKQKKSKE